MPVPTTHTSAVSSAASLGASGATFSLIQSERVAWSRAFMVNLSGLRKRLAGRSLFKKKLEGCERCDDCLGEDFGWRGLGKLQLAGHDAVRWGDGDKD